MTVQAQYTVFLILFTIILKSTPIPFSRISMLQNKGKRNFGQLLPEDAALCWSISPYSFMGMTLGNYWRYICITEEHKSYFVKVWPQNCLEYLSLIRLLLFCSWYKRCVMPETMNALCLIRFWNLGPISVFFLYILNKSVLGRRKKCGDSPLTYKIILIWQPPRPRLREHNSNYTFYRILV